MSPALKCIKFGDALKILILYVGLSHIECKFTWWLGKLTAVVLEPNHRTAGKLCITESINSYTVMITQSSIYNYSSSTIKDQLML